MHVLRTPHASRRDVLDELPAVAHVSGSGRDRLLTVFNEVTVPAGQTVLHAASPVDHLYLIARGTIASRDHTGAVALHGDGDVLGLRQLLARGGIPHDLVALSDVELWTMGRREFLGACKDVPGFALGILEASA